MMMPGKAGMPGMPPQMGMRPGMPMGMPQQMQQPPRPQGAAGPDPNAPLSAAALAAAPPAMQKQMLGTKLYPMVAKHQPEMAGKITGMMLEMDNSDLLILLESETQLKNKVDEAVRVLEAVKLQQEQQQQKAQEQQQHYQQQQRQYEE